MVSKKKVFVIFWHFLFFVFDRVQCSMSNVDCKLSVLSSLHSLSGTLWFSVCFHFLMLSLTACKSAVYLLAVHCFCGHEFESFFWRWLLGRRARQWPCDSLKILSEIFRWFKNRIYFFDWKSIPIENITFLVSCRSMDFCFVFCWLSRDSAVFIA